MLAPVVCSFSLSLALSLSLLSLSLSEPQSDGPIEGAKLASETLISRNSII